MMGAGRRWNLKVFASVVPVVVFLSAAEEMGTDVPSVHQE